MPKVILIILVLTFAASPALADSSCQSAGGGHCVNLVAASVTGLEFIGITPGLSVAQLVGKLYTFGLTVVALSAFVMFVVAGIEYLIAGDNQSRTTSAKRRMGNALWGIGIAFGSYLILYTINPDILKSPVDLKKMEFTPQQNNSAARPGPTAAQSADLARQNKTVIEEATLTIQIPIQKRAAENLTPEQTAIYTAEYLKKIKEMKNLCSKLGGEQRPRIKATGDLGQSGFDVYTCAKGK